MANEITIAQKQMIEKRLQEFRGKISPEVGMAQCTVDCLTFLSSEFKNSPVPYSVVCEAAINFVKKFFNNINHTVLTGNLTANPDLWNTRNNNAVCTFPLAVSRSYKTKGEYQTDYFKIEAWGAFGEKAAKYLKQGSKVQVVGSFEQYTYENDGVKKYDYKLKAKSIELLSQSGNLVEDVVIRLSDDNLE